MATDSSGSNLPEWVGAIGGIAATVVTATIALAGYLRDVRLRSSSARNAVLLAHGIAARAANQIQRVEALYLPERGPKAVRYGAREFVGSAGWLEVMEAITELRPQDLPDTASADSYVHVRALVREVDQMMQSIARLDASADGALDWPVFSDHQEVVAREAGHLKECAERYEHPLRNKAKVMALRWRLRKKREELKRAERKGKRLRERAS